jgi:mannonate dehydratase
VYTHANGRDIPEALDSVRKHMEEGYLAVRAQVGVPGVASSYGVLKAGNPYESAERGLPSESLRSTERYLNFAPSLFEKLGMEQVPDVHLLHDVHHRLTPNPFPKDRSSNNPSTSADFLTRSGWVGDLRHAVIGSDVEQ